ncbi:MAG: M4 family metallopeptidase [Hyphomicrobium sp.]|nr:M4 family metallopeptidase [Hyphomicrobium sp.]
MWKRSAALAGMMLALIGSAAVAEDAKPNYDRLKGLLEKKYAPPPSSGDEGRRAPAAEGPAAKNTPDAEVEWVAPDPAAKKRFEERRSAPGGTSEDSTWYEDLYDGAVETIWGKPGSSVWPFQLPDWGSLVPGAHAQTSGDGGVPVAKRNSYIIQLKPNASEQQVDELLRKYDLTVTDVIGDLGVLTVEQNAPAPAQGGGSGDAKRRLNDILDPPLVKALRREAIVDAAFVNSIITPNALPRAFGASIASGEQTFEWRWKPGDKPDGNWGLKAMRMPVVWSVIDRARKDRPDQVRPRIGIIDVGFAETPNVPYSVAIGAYRPPLIRPDCETNHGTHVAGIIGATQGTAPGIDGIVPNADIEAVSIGAEFIGERDKLDADQSWQAQAMLFSDVLANTMIYLTQNLRQSSNLRVVNVSLAYNFVARGVLGDADPDEVEGLKLHIAEQATVIRTMARLVENQVLFVVAAGNDSDGLADPIHTRWASPLAWAGTYEWTSGAPVKNILVVEAFDREGKRAAFSNVGGHVSAPGVDIMSTLGPSTMPFGVCSGTSQASPHVAALAALLFELDPAKTPAEVIEILKTTALPAKGETTSAPRVDALASVLAVSDDAARYLADIDANGTVDAADIAAYQRQMTEIDTAAATEAPFTTDLNGDNVVDDNECYFPRIDLNGDGEASLRDAALSRTGAYKSDLAVLEKAWKASPDEFKTAMVSSGLSARVASSMVAAASTPAPEAASSAPCRRKDPIVIAELGTGAASVVTPEAETPGTSAPAASPTAAPGSSTEPGAVDVAQATPGTVTPEEIRDEVAKGLDDLKKDNPELKVTINPATGLPLSISGFKPEATSLAAGARSKELTEDETRNMVEAFLGSKGLAAALPTRNKQAELAYVGRRKDPDFPGRYVANVEQRVNGIPVFGSSAKVTVETSLGVTRFQGATSAVAIADTTATLEREAAIAAGRKRLGELLRGSPNAPAPPLAMGPNPDTATASADLVVFDPALLKTKAKGPTRLAWLVAIDTYRIFIDAKTGEAFHYYRDRPTGLIRRVYDLGQTNTPAVVDEDQRKAQAVLPDDARLAFKYSGAVRDFFFLLFGRNGFDDNDGDGPNGGAPLDSYINYGTVKNAFWCPSKSYDCPQRNVMVFGPGYAGAIDIVAHEMVHGIIAHEANLVYSDEPGAVNEAIADIFGALIEDFAAGGDGTWLIGEAAPGFSKERPLRSLSNPNLTDETGTSLFDKKAVFSSVNRGQPDHYEDVVTPDDAICNSTWLNDNGCVHFNSGILNKFAYLLAVGGTHGGMTVEPIGTMKVARLTYRTLTTSLNATSGLLETADGYLQSCLDLAYGKIAGFTEADCNQVLAARQAVGLSFGS